MKLVGCVVALSLMTASLAEDQKPIKLDFGRLRGLNYRTGRITADVKALDGAMVRIAGYIVPLEDGMEQATEFLLVPTNGACIHMPPPPPNQIVHVKMGAGKKAKIFFGKAVWVEGKMSLSTVKSPYGDVAFAMSGTAVELLKEQ
jgi:hypothetical protein